MKLLKSTTGLILGVLFLTINFIQEVKKQEIAKQIQEEIKYKEELLLSYNKKLNK